MQLFGGEEGGRVVRAWLLEEGNPTGEVVGENMDTLIEEKNYPNCVVFAHLYQNNKASVLLFNSVPNTIDPTQVNNQKIYCNKNLCFKYFEI